jgi:hypothetical protein
MALQALCTWIENGVVVNVAIWDGVPGWAPEEGIDAVLVTSTTGPAGIGYAYANGVFVAPAVAPVVVTLEEAQTTQAAALSAACNVAITSGFQSSALGFPYSYPSNNTPQHPDQSNLDSSVTRSLLAFRKAGTWVADTQVAAGALVEVGEDLYQCVVAGPTGAQAPAWPTATGQIVNDGGAQWQLWATPFWCEDATGAWAWVQHTALQIQQVGEDAMANILSLQAKNATLQAQVLAADSVAAVQAIVW